jgi:pimeloyl-ACP methyl ester carboxylesterase/DNA-binding CsgD family transcriptional regulator
MGLAMQAGRQEAPPVQYAATPDGYSIAYTCWGTGIPVIFLPFHFNSLKFRMTLPWLRDVAQHAQVAGYDGRGQGLSSRNLERDLTLQDFRCDLDTVLGAVGFDRFVLAAYGGFGHVAIRYAVENPDRVHGLVLICTAESFVAYPWLALLPLAEANWDLFLRLQLKNIPPELVEEILAAFKSSITPADYTRLIRGFASSNVADALPLLHAPTLMIHSRLQHWLSPEEGARLAAKIEGARIFFPDEGEIEPEPVQGAQTIVDFLKSLPPVETKSTPGGGEGRLDAELSPRQREVLHLIAEGKTTREIADTLVLSERTIERHIADVYGKIGARNRSEATAYTLSKLHAST